LPIRHGLFRAGRCLLMLAFILLVLTACSKDDTNQDKDSEVKIKAGIKNRRYKYGANRLWWLCSYSDKG